jgi:hypothetical protein
LLSKVASGWRLAASGCVLFGWIYSIWDRSEGFITQIGTACVRRQ